jgi:branched-chain amino acid transport system permease protein
VALLILALGPAIFSDFYLSQIVTKALWLGIAAASLIFLAAYAGMVSLGQTALYGIGGFTMANLVLAEGGSDIALNPWVGVVLGILVATAIGLFFGAIASRSEGIYFLMITLAFAVITLFFFEKVTQISGFGGVNNVEAPGIVGNPRQDPENLFYIALVVAVAVYVGIRYLTRTPFGLALQGIRDDPTRMRALGYDVVLHRTLAFGVGAFIASLAGVLFVWWNSNISPGAINFGATIDVLVIAVVGGLFRIEGAWLGALVFAVLDNETRGISFIGQRFNTVIGAIFLLIILLSPGGLMGIWGLLRDQLRRAAGGRGPGIGEPPQPAASERVA